MRFQLGAIDNEIGLQHRPDNGKAVFELHEGDHHDHLVCNVCNKVVEFIDPVIEEKQYEIAEKNGFVLASHALVLYGICSDCNKKAGKR